MGLFGAIGLFYLASLWLFGLGPIGDRPLLLLSVMLCILSLQMISLGVIAEFFIRTKNPREVDTLISEFV
jgi:dolichol-phosphate mannosyltransferase